MGSYTSFTVADYPIVDSKSFVIPEVMTMFRESDRRVFKRRLSERNSLVWGVIDDDTEETAYEYHCQVANVIERLDVMGFTYAHAKRAFEAGVRDILSENEELIADEEVDSYLVSRYEFLKAYTFDAYVESLRHIMKNELRREPFDDYKLPELSPTVRFLLSEDDDEGMYFGFPSSEIRHIALITCEIAPPEAIVVQDVTEVVNAGYYSPESTVCIDAIAELTNSYPANSPRIIITEGSTDAKILQSSLALLYPHLAEYYSFIDFHFARMQGGAGQLVATVKAFAASGITNRVIAIFDNDTAAHEAVRPLQTITLPDNIAVRHYPAIELLRSYPTLGPTGPAEVDINGLAGSIEMYLGEDVLSDENGKLTPVQWKGFNQTLQRYQGEVLQKLEIQERFDAKLKRCKDDRAIFESVDWSGLRAILDSVFRAFE